MKSNMSIMIISGLLMICTLKGNAAEFINSHDRPDSAGILKQDSCLNSAFREFMPDPKYREKLRQQKAVFQYKINTPQNQQNIAEEQIKIIQNKVIPNEKQEQKGFFLIDRNLLRIHLENINLKTSLLKVEFAGHLTINIIF